MKKLIQFINWIFNIVGEEKFKIYNKNKEKISLKFEELKIDMIIIDEYNNVGIISEIKNENDIIINYIGIGHKQISLKSNNFYLFERVKLLTPLKHNQLHKGMKIIDIQCGLGVIIDLKDIKNIEVIFGKNMGKGLYCLDKCCNDIIYSYDEFQKIKH